MSNEINCSNCGYALFDEVFGEYKCKRFQKTCNESELAMGCDFYKKPGTNDDVKLEVVVRSGATFTPHVSDDGVISWTNDKGLPNPKPVELTAGLNGKDGEDGKDGADGKDGYTPVKGVDYFDGEDGEDGYTPIKGIDYFDGKDGIDGKNGEDGYTPVKGVDYFDGEPGKDGEDGYTPVKGVDYFDGVNGKDGEDGISPVVTVTNIKGGHRVTITDTDGTKTFDVMNGADGKDGGGGGSGGGIVDVFELPTEDIDESAFYRLMTAKFVCDGKYALDQGANWTCRCVETLPETGEVCTDMNMSYTIVYYNLADNGVYGYMSDELGSAFGAPAGWYPISALCEIASVDYSGIITDINDDPGDGTLRILLGYEFYTYKDEWTRVIFAYEKPSEFDIRWDGDMTDKFSLDMSLLGYDAGIYYTKVSDDVISVSQALGSAISDVYGDYTDDNIIVSEDDIDTNSFPGAIVLKDLIVIVHSSDELNAAVGLPSGTITNGIYFLSNTNASLYVSRLVAPSKITKIDCKYLDINELNSPLSPVAFTGNYYDLGGLPDIPTYVIRYDLTQAISNNGKQIARNNIDVYGKSEVYNKSEMDDKLERNYDSIRGYVSNELLSCAKTSDVYSKAEVDEKIGNAGGIDLSDYAKKSDIPTVPTKVSAFTNDADYAKKSEVTNMINEAIGSAIGGSY